MVSDQNGPVPRSDADDLRYCPACRSEYQAWVTACLDCGTALVAERPPDPPPTDHELVEVTGTGSFDHADRSTVDLLLGGIEIVGRWHGPSLWVPRARAEEAQGIVDWVGLRSEAGPELPAVPLPSPPVVPGAPPGFIEPALWQRFLGSVLDELVLLPLALLVFAMDRTAVLVVTIAVRVLYEALLVAHDGRTLGKRALRTRVVDASSGRIPSFAQAALRCWVFDALPAVVGLLVHVPGSFLYPLVVVAPILQRPLHRGLHDRAAHTVVTTVPR